MQISYVLYVRIGACKFYFNMHFNRFLIYINKRFYCIYAFSNTFLNKRISILSITTNMHFPLGISFISFHFFIPNSFVFFQIVRIISSFRLADNNSTANFGLHQMKCFLIGLNHTIKN